MEHNYTYPAIIDMNEPGYINISLPDFYNITTFVEKGEDYLKAVQEVLALTIIDYEAVNKKIPEPSDISNIYTSKKQFVVYVNVWLPYYRSRVKEEYVKKTLTIPAWLDILAKNNSLNFSAILVKGLKDELGLDNKSGN